jgi:hypothetical protein
MAEDSEKQAKKEFGEPVNYERRAAAFYDILGWRSKIEWAGEDAARLGLLKDILTLFGRKLKRRPRKHTRMTSFSDNVVVSTTAERFTGLLLMLCGAQLTAAAVGMFIRGGVTIGELVHEDRVVFGPALNRAYYLESSLANNPLLLLDPLIEWKPLYGPSIIAREGEHSVLNPFTFEFVDWLIATIGVVDEELLGRTAEECLLKIKGKLDEEIRVAPGEKELNKLKWLQDRVALQLNSRQGGGLAAAAAKNP